MDKHKQRKIQDFFSKPKTDSQNVPVSENITQKPVTNNNENVSHILIFYYYCNNCFVENCEHPN